jgi:NRAMP (natural resistance-associated macrophage protein)-like metal ion transporter
VTRRRSHTHRSRISGFGYFRNLGPGLVTGASDDDPSGIGTYSQVGAAFGFGLVWTALVTLPLAVAVQEACARLGIVAGRGLASMIKERFPRPVMAAAVAIVAGANVFNIGADLGAMAEAIRLLVPLPFGVLIVALTTGMVALEVWLPYRTYSKILRWLTLSLVTYVGVLLVVEVDWGHVVRNTFVPTLEWSKERIAALIAIFGTTISPYLFFWQTSEEVEERRADERTRVSKNDIREMRIDIVAGMGSAVVVMFAIMVSSGATLHEEGITTIGTAAEAARALEPVAGAFAEVLFALGIVGTGLLAVPVLAGSTAYAAAEALGSAEGLGKPLGRAPAFYAILGGAMGLGLAMNFIGIEPVRALYFAAILNGVAAPPLLLLLLLLSRSSQTVRSWTGGMLSTVLLCVTLLAMAGLPIAYVAA